MKRLLSIASAFVFCVALNAQSLATAIQYIGAAASANATKRQLQRANGVQPSIKVAFQMDVEVSGRVHWGKDPILSTGIYSQSTPLRLGGNKDFAGGPALNLNLGVRFNDSYFVGAGVQLEANFGKTKATLGADQFTAKTTNIILPIYGIFKVYIPSSNGVSPYFDLALGGYIPDWYVLKNSAFKRYDFTIEDGIDARIKGDKLHYHADKGGFYGHAAVGVDINHIQISAGYELTTYSGNSNTHLFHNIFLKLGYRIGG